MANDKEIVYRIKSIIITSLILVVATYYWFNIRPSLANTLSMKEINYSDIYLEGETVVDLSNKNLYRVKVINNSDTNYTYALSLTNYYLSHEKIISEQVTFAFQLSDGNFTEDYQLYTGGDLIYDVISPHSELEYDIQINDNNNYNTKGKIILTVNQETLAIN